MPLKLSEVKEPLFEIEFPDGTTKSYDPWELSEKVGEAVAAEPNTFDAIRKALGFPTQADVDGSDVVPKPYTPSRHHCMAIQEGCLDLISKLDVSKKLRDLSQM